MDPEISTILTPTSQPTPGPVQKKCKHLPIVISLAIIAVVGIGFGGFEFYQNLIKNSETDTLKHQLATNSDNNVPSGDASSLPSVENAEKMLENYTGSGLKIMAMSLNASYNTFISNFDDNQKAFLAYSHVERDEKNTVVCVSERYENGRCTEKSIGYDLINQKYQSLFGDSVNMKKENYTFQNFFYLVYNSTTNTYDEYILPGGGASPIFALHKVISTKSSPDGFIATVSFIQMDLDVKLEHDFAAGTTLSGGLGVKDETADDAIKSMAIYEFKFVKNGDTYVLTSVTKLGDE